MIVVGAAATACWVRAGCSVCGVAVAGPLGMTTVERDSHLPRSRVPVWSTAVVRTMTTAGRLRAAAVRVAVASDVRI